MMWSTQSNFVQKKNYINLFQKFFLMSLPKLNNASSQKLEKIVIISKYLFTTLNQLIIEVSSF